MPLCQISLRAGKPDSYRRAIGDSLYLAMLEILNVPEDDQFMTITEHDDANFRHGTAYGVDRSEDLVYFRIITFDGRPAAKKNQFFERLVERLAENPGIRPEDVFVNLVESPRENWWAGYNLARPA